jgi:hypothetical protein
MQYILNIVPDRVSDFFIKLQELKRLGIVENDMQEEEIKKEKIEQFIGKWGGAFQTPKSEDKDTRLDYLMEKYK